MARRTLASALALALALAAAGVPRVAWAQDDAEPVAVVEEAPAADTPAAETPAAEAPAYSADEPPALSSPVALLVDRDTGYVLFEQGADEQRTPASITKILTALVVLENASLDDVVTVEEGDFEHVTAESTTAGLKAGDVLTVRDLLAGLLLPSGNDAAYVLARAVGGDWQTFVGMMNEKAASLGCTSTHFSDPCGLAEDNHYTTARDLVTIFEAAMAYPAFQEIAGSTTWEMPATGESPARTITTTDLLLDPESPVYMDGIIGASKTGSTLEGGKCLIAEARQGDRTLVCVVLGAPMSGDSKGITSNFHDTKALVEWGFGAWQTGEVVSPGDPLLSVDVEFSSDGDEVGIEATSAIVATVPADLTLDDLTITPTWSETLRAPLTEGSTVGEVTVALDDQQLGTVSVAPVRSVGLSIPDFVIWWITSDISHALIVAAVVVALFAVIGIICGVSAKKRRLREQRLRVSSGRSYGVSPDVAGARRTTYGHGAPASGKRAAAPKGSGRHMRQ